MLLEPLETVARGDAVTLRGTALLGNRPFEGVELTVGDQGGAVSDATGAFDYRYQVSSEHPLGASEVTVAATDLNISASVRFEVRSAPNIIVTPVDTRCGPVNRQCCMSRCSTTAGRAFPGPRFA